MSNVISRDQLESVQAYDHAAREIKRYEPVHRCGYCLDNPVEEEDGTCEYCRADLKELE